MDTALEGVLIEVYSHPLVICQIRRPQILRILFPWSAPGHSWKRSSLPMGKARTSQFIKCERKPQPFVSVNCSPAALGVHVAFFLRLRRPGWPRMCFQRPPHSGERRKPPHHDSLLNQLICSPLLGGFGRSKLRKLHMACRSYAWLLAGHQSQGSENNYFEKMTWEDGSCTEKFSGPPHRINNCETHI